MQKSNFPEHIQWIINRVPEQTVRGFKKMGITVEQAFQTFMLADPTPNKRLVDWMIKAYGNGGFLWEDVAAGDRSKVSETLVWFAENFKRLPADQRDIYKHANLASVYKSIQEFLVISEEIGSREKKRRERDNALENSIILYKDERMIVSVPLTQSAAVWWGRGTRWCTAASKSDSAADQQNYFDYYNDDAPLIVMVFPQGLKSEQAEKYQLWSGNEGFQFMDAADEMVDKKTILNNWSVFEPFILWAMQRSAEAIDYIPLHLRTPSLILEQIKRIPETIHHLHPHERTREICDIAVGLNSQTIEGVPLEFIDQNMIDQIKDWDGVIFERIYDKLSLERISAIIEESPYRIEHLGKEHFLTFIRMAVDETKKNADKDSLDQTGLREAKFDQRRILNRALDLNVFYDLPTDIVIDLIANQDHFPRKFDPLEFYKRGKLSIELFTAIAEKESYAFSHHEKHVEIINQNQEFAIAWTRVRGLIGNDVRSEYRNRDFYLAALSRNGNYIKEIPEEMKDYLMYLAAANGMIPFTQIEKIPHAFKTEELFVAVLTNAGSILDSIPQRYWTPIMIWASVTDCAYNMKSIVDLMKKPEWKNKIDWNELFKVAVVSYSRAILEIPPQFLNKEIVEASCRKNPWHIKSYPEWITPQFVEEMVGKKISLDYIPFELLTEKTIAIIQENYSEAELKKYSTPEILLVKQNQRQWNQEILISLQKAIEENNLFDIQGKTPALN